VRPSASADTLVKLADALKVSLDYLLGRSDEMTPSSTEIQAVFRALRGASADRIAAFEAVARALAEEERARRRGKG
jgi:transcriptional regulator with XRE-family HTH domain